MAIWQMNCSVDYLALAYADEAARTVRHYVNGKSLKWQPVGVKYDTDLYDDTDERHERVPDFPRMSGSITCNEAAKSTLDQAVHEYVEFLPLTSTTIKDEQYYFFYPKVILDCLDNEQSDFVRSRTGYIRGISRHVFRPDCIGDTPIFRLPVAGSLWGWPFVNDRLKRLIEDNNLTGLEFRKVWEG